MEGTEIHSSNSLLDHVYLLQQQNYTERKRRFSAKSCSFGQLCFKLTYNGSIVGFFTKPEFSQFLHQVFSNITNHQRLTLQKGNSRGEGLIREIFLITLKKKSHVMHICPQLLRGGTASTCLKFQNIYFNQKNRAWRQVLRTKSRLSVLLSVLKATRLVIKFLATPEVGCFCF